MPHDWQHTSERFGPLVWKTLFRILRTHAESADCYQDVMLEAFERSQHTTIENWGGFLRWIAVRRGIDRLRQRKRQNDRIDSRTDIELVATDAGENDAPLGIQELKDRLRHELAAVSKDQATAFWLRCVEELSYAEIAQQMSLNENAVGVLIHRARAHIRDALHDLCPTEPGA